MTTRWTIAITGSPGNGNFAVRSVGCPTTVGTRYISPTCRSSCCCVATVFESGDHETIARSLPLQPALSVAYPKYCSPSVVSWRSRPRGGVAHPQVPVANEHAVGAVGRHRNGLAVRRRDCRAAAATATAATPARTTAPGARDHRRLGRAAGNGGRAHGSGLRRRIDEDRLRAPVDEAGAIPEAIGAERDPGRRDGAADDQARERRRQKLLGARVVRSRHGLTRLPGVEVWDCERAGHREQARGRAEDEAHGGSIRRRAREIRRYDSRI